RFKIPQGTVFTPSRNTRGLHVAGTAWRDHRSSLGGGADDWTIHGTSPRGLAGFGNRRNRCRRRHLDDSASSIDSALHETTINAETAEHQSKNSKSSAGSASSASIVVISTTNRSRRWLDRVYGRR